MLHTKSSSMQAGITLKGDIRYKRERSIPTIVWKHSASSSLHVWSTSFLTNSTRLIVLWAECQRAKKNQIRRVLRQYFSSQRYVAQLWDNVKWLWYSNCVTLKANWGCQLLRWLSLSRRTEPTPKQTEDLERRFVPTLFFVQFVLTYFNRQNVEMLPR